MQKLRVVPGREQTGLFPRELLLLKKHYREFYLQLECRLATCSKNKSPGKCRRDRRRRGLGGDAGRRRARRGDRAGRRRAVRSLRFIGLIGPDEEQVVAKVLNAAAWTYVAATLTSVMTLLFYLFQAGVLGGRRRRD
jgi:Putative neutral zinc metallopeptidase